MAIRIRLKRMGAKKAPFYRVVAAESSSPRDGKFVAELGYYNPIKDPPVIQVDEERVFEWLRRGAKPTDTVRSLLRKQGLLKKWDALKKGKSNPPAPSEVAESN